MKKQFKMIDLDKISLKRVMFVALCFFLLLCLALGGWVLQIIYSIPTERIEQVAPELVREFSVASNLERGGVVRDTDLKSFYLFSAEGQTARSFELWVASLLERGKIERLNTRTATGGSEYLLRADIELASPLINDCESVYCLQHRMTFDEIPAVFWKGLIGIEDYRFLDHFGVDWRSVVRAILVDLIEMRFAQGASTLTQQLAKNLFYSNEKTLVRKFKEMVTAVYIDAKYPKENILEAYFNEVYWGAFQGIQLKGLYAATTFYFQKEPKNIAPYEAAILIGLLKGPGFYHPIRQFDRLRSRTEIVYQRLIEIGLFGPELDQGWTEQQWEKWRDDLKQRSQEKNFFALWHALEAVSSQKEVALEPYQIWVFHHIAYQHHKLMSQMLGDSLEGDLAVKALIRPLKSSAEDFYYYSKPERSLIRALSSERHQVGSSIKPLVYGLFLDAGIDLDESVSVEELTLELKSGPWSPRELSAAKDRDTVSVGEALQKSFNRPVIRLAQQVGFDHIEEQMNEKYGFDLLSPLAEYPSQLLGAIEMSPSELVDALEKFIYRECELRESRSEQGLIELLSNPSEGTVRLAITPRLAGLRFFGKTGTSNMGHDTWFVFFDGESVGVIWLGSEAGRGIGPLGMYGSTGAFPIYRDFIAYNGKRFPELECPDL